ncbi:hypothetical protein F511_30122 [Dorcoceras hygrometricum]|uniref:Uncharacterized protein n=1 Tax=Dorcoceras hygrometricum TaxID=472368 RepID=A0A2Z7A8L6_9LAMI|nr:hypothetical protein F511_30122 [Dorcoceras hygrometricum]
MILTVQKLFHHVSHTLFKFHLDPKYATSEDLYIRDPHQVATRKEIKHCHHVSQVLSSKQTSVSCQTPSALIFAVVIWVYEIFRISGLLCVTDGLDPLEEQNIGTDQ